jgi:hypothetical protein
MYLASTSAWRDKRDGGEKNQGRNERWAYRPSGVLRRHWLTMAEHDIAPL